MNEAKYSNTTKIKIVTLELTYKPIDLTFSSHSNHLSRIECIYPNESCKLFSYKATPRADELTLDKILMLKLWIYKQFSTVFKVSVKYYQCC